MKKFLVFLALVLLVVSGTGYAVTCAYDNVPAATLLVPYWTVSINKVIPGLPSSTLRDTMVGIVNVSAPGVIAHVTVWNKYSKAILDFNVPLTGKDTAYFNMSDILKGNLNVNATTQNVPGIKAEVCGLDLSTPASPKYLPVIGWGQTQFIRFSNPEANQVLNNPAGGDAFLSISQYNNPAFFGLFRDKVLDSLDESGDITFDDAVTNIIDTDNPACLKNAPSDGKFSGDFAGYLTIDVVNFCTNYFPSDAQYYMNDAIATAGWNLAGAAPCSTDYPCYTPNVLFGDVFFIDGAAVGGNISGDQAIPLEFDSRLQTTKTGGTKSLVKTFYGRYVDAVPSSGIGSCGGAPTEFNGIPCTIFNTSALGSKFWFAGDGREPLGDRYGFRYYANSIGPLQSWLTVWRSDAYPSPITDLCTWLTSSAANKLLTGFNDPNHALAYTVYNDDEASYTKQGSGGPSGGGVAPPGVLYVYLETQRIDLLHGNGAFFNFNPVPYTGGWADLQFRASFTDPIAGTTLLQNQAYVGVQHTDAGLFVSVGYSAANLNNQFNCIPNVMGVPGNSP